MTAPESSESETPFGLRWGVKRSFVEYIRRMPDGKGAAGSGAVSVGDDEICFAPEVSGRRPDANGGEERFWAFRGDVRFSGHFGMLFVRLADPMLHMQGNGEAELTVDDPEKEGEENRLPLVTLRLARQESPVEVEIWQGSEVRLSEPGTGLFNNVYPPGEPFEPLTLVVPVVPEEN
ncbi:MAG TPA: HtaA domain-containing protein [Pseudonocardiaceae bacterium]|jgi:hypothetical protein|nr:HtaA domain-containing protein [Pseudonocardiaceae bacterium]